MIGLGIREVYKMEKVDIFSQNRELLSNIIMQFEEFTYDELLDEYKKDLDGQATMSIGGGWTIKDYLEFCCQVGILELNYDVYTVLNGNRYRRRLKRFKLNI